MGFDLIVLGVCDQPGIVPLIFLRETTMLVSRGGLESHRRVGFLIVAFIATGSTGQSGTYNVTGKRLVVQGFLLLMCTFDYIQFPHLLLGP